MQLPVSVSHLPENTNKGFLCMKASISLLCFSLQRLVFKKPHLNYLMSVLLTIQHNIINREICAKVIYATEVVNLLQ